MIDKVFTSTELLLEFVPRFLPTFSSMVIKSLFSAIVTKLDVVILLVLEEYQLDQKLESCQSVP